ncbi:hypothetical protein OAS39_05325 [Pirellulales bacterium]|nr:hypothetical protein [Pirellulales bacterium]
MTLAPPGPWQKKDGTVVFPAWAVWLVGAVLAVVAGVVWRRLRAAQIAARRKLAALEFRDRREELAKEFLEAAAATGKPRGLRWKSCELHDDLQLAADRATGELLALIGATIAFEAIEGGGMEDVEAVGNLRCVSAVFVHRAGQWSTDGRAVFNLQPEQALEHYAASLEPVAVDA